MTPVKCPICGMEFEWYFRPGYCRPGGGDLDIHIYQEHGIHLYGVGTSPTQEQINERVALALLAQ